MNKKKRQVCLVNHDNNLPLNEKKEEKLVIN